MKKLSIEFIALSDTSLWSVAGAWLRCTFSIPFLYMCVCVFLFHYADLRSQSLALPLIKKSSYLPSQRIGSDCLTSLKYLWDGKTLMLNLVRYVFWLLSWQV